MEGYEHSELPETEEELVELQLRLFVEDLTLRFRRRIDVVTRKDFIDAKNWAKKVLGQERTDKILDDLFLQESRFV